MQPLQVKMLEYIKKDVVDSDFYEGLDIPVFTKVIKNFDFKIPRDKHAFLAAKLMGWREDSKYLIENSKKSIDDYDRRLNEFLPLLEDGKETECVNYITNQRTLETIRSYYRDMCRIKKDVDKGKVNLEHYEYLNHKTKVINLNLAPHHVKIIRELLFKYYQELIDNGKFKLYIGSIDKLDKAIKYKKGLVDCTLSIL